MTELTVFAAIYVLLALLCMIRVAKGPSVVDRAVAADSVDILTDVALVLFALESGRGIYLDIALVTAILGFLSMVCVARYLEGRL
ncbi:MAG: monovalent cation/H+ antiporter complex subunit F [Oscillospiraceae bacterium]|nr:monovalent cation/H+ antiporter complex subunit F [bacterium]MDY5101218.1 monovalent cation/H+ antiporter complex subunit F [Oscillospiraceae bacterium]